MCDPFTLMFAAGTGLSAFGSWSQGVRQAEAARMSRDVAKSNVELLRQQAAVLREDIPVIYARGAYTQTRLAEKEAIISGGQIGHFAASGMDALYGSALQLQTATAAQAVVERGLVAAQTRLEVAGKFGQIAQVMTGAASQAAQAYASEQAAIDARIAGAIGAGTALLTGGAKVGARFGSFGPSPMASSTSYDPFAV